MGIIIKKPKRFDISKYNFAFANPSAAHTYGNVTAVMVNYIKSLFSDNYFKYIHVSTKIAYKEFDFRRNTQTENFKKSRPVLIIKPRVVMDDNDMFMSNSPLTRKLTDNFFIRDKGDLMPFFHDDKNNIYVKYALNRMCMEFEVMIVVETVMEQLNVVTAFKNRMRQDMDFTIETALESLIPENVIDLISHGSNIPVFDENDKIKRFLDYMNCNSGYPITYKLKGSTKRNEFFRYYNAKLDTKFTSLNFDEGSKKGMVSDTATITFNVRTEFWGAGMYYYFTANNIPKVANPQPDNVLELFSTTLYKNTGLPDGYKLYTTAAFKTDEFCDGKEDNLVIDQLINPEIEQLMDYCNTTGTSIEPFIKIILMEDSNVLEDDKFSFNLETRTLYVYESHFISTYRIYLYINQLYFNNYMNSILDSDYDVHKRSVDAALIDNQFDITLPPHYKISDNAIIPDESLLIYDIPNSKPDEEDTKDYNIYVGKIPSRVPNSRFLDKYYTSFTEKSYVDSIQITETNIDNKCFIICIPEVFRDVTKIYYTDDLNKSNILKQFSIGYIQLKGEQYRYYILGKDTIESLKLTFEFIL